MRLTAGRMVAEICDVEERQADSYNFQVCVCGEGEGEGGYEYNCNTMTWIL